MQNSVDWPLSFAETSVPFGVTYEKIGTIQRRLAWPLHKDDTLSRSGRPTGLNIYFQCRLQLSIQALACTAAPDPPRCDDHGPPACTSHRMLEARIQAPYGPEKDSPFRESSARARPQSSANESDRVHVTALLIAPGQEDTTLPALSRPRAGPLKSCSPSSRCGGRPCCNRPAPRWCVPHRSVSPPDGLLQDGKNQDCIVRPRKDF